MGVNEFIRVGDKIKTLRKKQGISQKEMAKIVGIPYTTYSNYENNNREPNKDALIRIAIALHCRIDELLETPFIIDVGDSFSIGGVEALTRDSNKDNLLKAFNNLNTLGQVEAVKRVEELTEIKKYTE